MATAVAFSEIQDQLLTLDQVREQLAATEPLQELTFPTSKTTKFTLQPGWADTTMESPTSAILRTPAGAEYQLTRKAVEEAGAYCGAPRGFQNRLPATILEDILDHFFQEGFGDKEFKLLGMEQAGAEHPLAMAMCRGTITPFSNLRLLDVAIERIQALYGTGAEIYADYKFRHDLEMTNLRLIVPGASRTITGTRVADDTWCAGLDIRNSLIGLKPTDISAYLFRWWCTNGATSTLASSGKFSRRGKHDDDDVWTWAESAVNEALGGLEGVFDAVQTLTTIPVNGDTTVVLKDLFAQYGVPQRERQRVIEDMADLGGDITLYDIQQAITRAANAPDLPSRAIEQLLGLGGHVAHAATARCNSCRRLLPEGWEIPGHAHHDHAEAISA
jgi:hypothetical protein